MDPVVPSSTKKPRRLLWVGIVAVVLLVAVVAAISLLIAGNTKQEATSQTSPSASPAPAVSVATKDEVKQNLSQLDTSLKQAQADQAAAKAAIKDSTNQIKVGN